jgi:hypothetical protein
VTRDLLAITSAESPVAGYDVEVIADQAEVDVNTVADVLEAIQVLERGEFPWRDPDMLRHLYQDKGLDQHEIADRLGCGQRTICRWMNRHQIPTARPGATGDEWASMVTQADAVSD